MRELILPKSCLEAAEQTRPWRLYSLQCPLPDPSSTAVGEEVEVVSHSPNYLYEVDHTLPDAPLASSSSPLAGVPKRRINSKSEYVRCLALGAEGTALYIATNRGLIHRVELPGTASSGSTERWTTLYVSSRQSPLCTLSLAELPDGTVALGLADISGWAAALRCSSSGVEAIEWRPYGPLPALNVFFSTALNSDLVFTAGAEGRLSLWRLSGCSAGPVLLAEALCPLRSRAISLSACSDAPHEGSASNGEAHALGLLITTGTSEGGLAVWRLRVGTCDDSSTAELTPVVWLKSAHDGGPVREVTMAWKSSRSGPRIEIESFGCNASSQLFTMDLASSQLVRLREHKYDALMVPSGRGLVNKGLVFGFHTTKVVVWDEALDAEVCAVYFTSWRKPWAAHVAANDDLTLCLEVGNRITVYRRVPLPRAQNGALPAVAVGDDSALSHAVVDQTLQLEVPRVFLSPNHGREINAVRLLRLLRPGPNEPGELVCFTGGGDATVRLASFLPGGTQRASRLVEDHYGGTPVKAMATAPLGGGKHLLVTGGAKQVLMAWMVSTGAQAEDGVATEWVATHTSAPNPRSFFKTMQSVSSHQFTSLGCLQFGDQFSHIL